MICVYCWSTGRLWRKAASSKESRGASIVADSQAAADRSLRLFRDTGSARTRVSVAHRIRKLHCAPLPVAELRHRHYLVTEIFGVVSLVGLESRSLLSLAGESPSLSWTELKASS